MMVLESAKTFAGARVGEGRQPPIEAAAFNVLYEDGQAVERFATVAEKGDLPAKLYALAAFRQLDRQRFNSLYATLSEDDTPVEAIASCTPDVRPVRQRAGFIATYDEAEAFRSVREEAIREWSRKLPHRQ